MDACDTDTFNNGHCMQWSQNPTLFIFAPPFYQDILYTKNCHTRPFLETFLLVNMTTLTNINLSMAEVDNRIALKTKGSYSPLNLLKFQK